MAFLNNLNWRYATKKFDTQNPITDDVLAEILEAARMAPSSFGLQPFHITVVKDPELRAKLRAAAWDQAQITDSTAVLVFSAKAIGIDRIDQYLDMASGGNAEAKENMKEYGNMMRNSVESKSTEELMNWGAKQAYISLGFALAAAAELKVDAAPMEGFDNAAFKEILGLDETLMPAVILCLGNRDHTETIRPKVRFPNSDLIDMR